MTNRAIVIHLSISEGKISEEGAGNTGKRGTASGGETERERVEQELRQEAHPASFAAQGGAHSGGLGDLSTLPTS